MALTLNDVKRIALLARIEVAPDEAGEVIGREATRLERLVQDLLDLARLRARRFSARDDALDLGRVTGEISRRFAEKARALGI